MSYVDMLPVVFVCRMLIRYMLCLYVVCWHDTCCVCMLYVDTIPLLFICCMLIRNSLCLYVAFVKFTQMNSDLSQAKPLPGKRFERLDLSFDNVITYCRLYTLKDRLAFTHPFPASKYRNQNNLADTEKVVIECYIINNDFIKRSEMCFPTRKVINYVDYGSYLRWFH